ncbi:ThuA domain-containing protein [bacterium]|nr:ThuA domain-containing protein [bacterium]
MEKDTKVLLLVGGADYHDQPEHRQILSDFIGAEFNLTMTDNLEVLIPGTLDNYDVIVNYTTFVEPTEEQVDALLDAVKGGKGFVGIHGATASFWNSPDYLLMIGGKFIAHDVNKEFLVQISDARAVVPHPITKGVDNFTIQDELYIIEGDITRWEILARAEGHAVIFNKTYGKGRVHNNALGHDAGALNHLSFQRLVNNGIAWAAGL